MSITSLSFSFSSTAMPVSARPADPAKATAQAAAASAPSSANRESDSEDDHDDDRRTPGPTSRLAQAIMAALHAIGLGAPAAPAAAASAGPANAATTPGATTAAAGAAAAGTPAAPAPSATPTPGASTTPAASIPAEGFASAVYQFAHELYAALRPAGRSDGYSQGQVFGGGEGHRQESHGEYGWKSQGYGDIAQRLEALAQRLTQSPTSASNASGSTSGTITVTVTLNDGAPAAQPTDAAVKTPASPASVPASPATTTTLATAATPAVSAGVGAATQTNLAPNDATHPLVEAFTTLFSALQPQGPTAAESDMAAKLRAFLKALAQSLSPAAANGGIQPLAVGGLVNVTA